MVMHMDPKYYMPDSIVKRPARTMIQWVRVKQHVPTRFGPSDVTALAARYRMLPETDPVPTATQEYGKKDARITIDGTPEDFSAFPVVTIPFGKPIEVTAGLINIDVSDKTTTRTLVVKAPAKITLVSRTKVEVHKGLVGADFPVELVTPGGTVKPTGTVVQVHVDDMGNTKIDTLHGTVEVTSTDGTVKTLNIGESLELAANGAMSAVSTCDPQQLMDQLIPAVESPFTDQPAGISLDWTGIRDKIRTLPWWAVLAAGILFFVLLGTMLFLLRRLLAALIAGPLMTIGLVAVGRLLINNPVVENMTFGEFLLSPWTAWQTGHEWLPAAAWAIGGLVAGMIIGGFIRGFLTGCIMPVIPWLIYHYDLAVPASWDWDGISDSLLQLVKASPGDLVTLLAVTGFCALVGGMLLPRKKRAPLQAGGSRPSRRRMINRDNDGDWYDHHHHDDNDFDGDDGDD